MLLVQNHFEIEFKTGSVFLPETKDEDNDEPFSLVITAEDDVACEKRYGYFIYWTITTERTYDLSRL